MATLTDKLLNDEVRPKLVADCDPLVDAEVAKQRGVSGFAVKGAYKTVKAVKRTFVREVVDALIDQWVAKLEPIWVDYQAAGSAQSFGSYAAGRREEVAELLLQVTDARVAGSSHGSVKKLYLKLRPGAKVHVVAAVPGLGQVVDRYL